MKKFEKYIEIFKSTPLFYGLTDSEIYSALKAANANIIAKENGEYIFREGDKTECMGFVLSGCVMILQEDFWGNRNIISHIYAGDIFAEIFAASASLMNVSAVADGKCEIMLVNISNLLNFSGSSGATFARNLASFLARKALTLNEKITHISKRSTREKLLSFLSAQSQKQGKSNFYISYDRRQLADYLCVERAAMCAELSKLQKEGILKYKKNYFELKEITENQNGIL